jgi:flagellar biosynthesis activator protein FlaF
MSNNLPPGSAHAGAATTYGTHAQKNTSDPREVEARVLLKAANMLQDLQTNWNADNLAQIDETLKFNRQVWMIFFDTAVENKDGNRPDDLRSNIINLANFVFKRTVEILGDPQREKLEALITINRNIAAGLMSAPANMPGANNNPSNASASTSA